MEGATRVHCVSGGGGGEGLFRFDWGGASESFEYCVEMRWHNIKSNLNLSRFR